MKTTTLSTCLQNELTLQIFENMNVKLAIKHNPYQIPIDKLFKMAARINRKRGFLFVSTVLGKHIPVNPYKPLITSGLLAIEYYERKTGKKIDAKEQILDGFLSEEEGRIESAYALLRKQTLSFKAEPIVIGFAETATSLGHAVFDCIEKAYFVPTTREVVNKLDPALYFEEEHSHAVDQRCFIPIDQLQTTKPIMLVDDEITTGKTALNIIRDIHRKHPRKEYSILSILDWRSDEDIERFREVEKELDITITTVSLLSGNFLFCGKPLDEATYNYQITQQDVGSKVQYLNLSSLFTSLSLVADYTEHERNPSPYIKETGRFGLTDKDRYIVKEACLQAGEMLKGYRQGKRTLCLGTGELMYVPMKISTFMGEGVFYHSTTRSPIHPVQEEHYGIENGFRFFNPEHQKTVHYVYNIRKNDYDDVFFFLERKVSEKAVQPIINLFKDRGIKSINIVTLSDE